MPLLVFAGSLAAILSIYGLTRWLGLGAKPVLDDDSAARAAAGEVEDGFDPLRISRSRSRDAALLRDGAGRVMVIKRHGGQFAGRILTSAASAKEEVDALIVYPGPAEAQFGAVRLRIADSAIWADAINRL